MQSILLDLRFCFRQLARKPGFTAIAIFTLALGTGANALMFAVVDTVLLRPLPYPESHQLVDIASTQPDGGRSSTSLPNFLDVRVQSSSFSTMAAYFEKSASVRLPSGEPIHSAGAAASSTLFDVLQVPPMIGRAFSRGQDQPGRPCSVVLSARFWRKYLSGDAGVVGKHLTIDGQICAVSGVMPEGFSFPAPEDDFWIALQPAADTVTRGADFLDIVGRLKPGVTLSAAKTELNVIARRLQKAYPDDDKGYEIRAQLYRDKITGNARAALFALLGAVALLLLIACTNIANLQLAHALGRKREMAIRAALGASRMRVARQLLTENLVLALMGTGVGLGIAAGCLDFLKRLAANAIPRVEEIDLRPQVLLAMLMVGCISACLFGLAPVWQAARQDIEAALRENSGAVGGARGQQTFRDILVVAQLSLAIVLVAGSGLLLRSLYELLHTDRGFTADHVLTMQTAVSGTEGASMNLATMVYGPELDRLEQIPGVKAAGFVTFLPLSNGHASASFSIKGRANPDPQTGPRASLNAASDDFFRALKVPLLRGRYFEKTDSLGKTPVVIVNEALARRYFAGQNPIGKQVTFEDPESVAHPLTIVGVVRGSRQLGLGTPPDAELYLDFRQVPPGTLWSEFLLKQIMTYVVRVDGDPAAISGAVQRVIHRVDPAQTVFHVAMMGEIVLASVQSSRLAAILLSVFAGLALVVAAAGLFGVLSYMITQNSRNIAVRMALGARQTQVVRMIVLRAFVLYAIALCCGLIGVICCGRLLSSMLVGVRPWDAAALSATTAILLIVSLLAAWFPARKAAAIDPYEALRSQ